MKKRLLLLPIFAGMVLSGCDFSLESLKFWEKKTEVADQGGTNTPSSGDNGSNGGNENGGNQNGGNENGGNNNGGNENGGNNGGNENGGGNNGGGEEEGDSAYFDFEELTSTSGSSNGFSFKTAKGTGNNEPAYNSNYQELRLYVGNTITFTSKVSMKYIYFDANSCSAQHDKANGTLAASVGTMYDFEWEGDAKEVTFTVDSGKQVHINAIYINDDEAGGGGGEVIESTEFPSEAINAYTEELGSSIHLPAFSGTAISYSFSASYGQLDIEVGAGNETAAIEKYASDLLGSNDFVEGEEDTYGDMHYISTDEKLDVCPWDANDAKTPVKGHIYVDIVEYYAAATSDKFPLEYVNAYLNSDSNYGFTFTQSEADSISALSTQFAASVGTDSYGYPMCQVGILGTVASQVESIIKSTITAAGFTYDSEYEAYYNSKNYCVALTESDGVTYLILD